MVVLDTNIIIDHLRQEKGGETTLMRIAQDISADNIAISLISVQELYEGESTRNEKKEAQLLSVIAPLKILPYTYEIAELAGELARDLGRPIELADAAIAATTIVHGARLATLNKKDFSSVPGLELYTAHIQ